MVTTRRASARPADTARAGRRRGLLLLGVALVVTAIVGVLVWSSAAGGPGGVGSVAGGADPDGLSSNGAGPEATSKAVPPAPQPTERDEDPREARDAPSTGGVEDTSPGAGPSPAPSETAGPHTYAFPVVPAEAASYGRDHHTYPATDVFAACGTTLVAITDGVVDEAGRTDGWDPAVDDPATRSGRFVSIVGDDGVRYYLSHLESVEPGVTAGARVSAGEPIGSIGRSGNARSTPCHAHFGISPPLGPGDWEVRRGVIWPWPYLDAWREGRQLSPAEEVATWAP
jgi:peptidoglycan LD-endopeptidase LytH